MVNKIVTMLINILFPMSYLQTYLKDCSQLQFEHKIQSQLQTKERMFFPFMYKNTFVRDCIIELKERNSKDVARLYGKIINQWITKKIIDLKITSQVYIVPVPQHVSKTKEKGFCHTTTLAYAIQKINHRNYPHILFKVNPCISKNILTKKLHNSKDKRARFKLIKNTMRAHITKYDARNAYFFIVDDVFTTGATFKEVRRSLLDCAVPLEHMFFISIAH